MVSEILIDTQKNLLLYIMKLLASPLEAYRSNEEGGVEFKNHFFFKLDFKDIVPLCIKDCWETHGHNIACLGLR